MDQYTIIPILEGVPITSNRGALGWSSSTVIQGRGRTILLDTGSYSDRSLFLSNLANHGFGPDSFDTVVLSHFHYDHMINAEILPAKRLLLSRAEQEYILSEQFRQAEDNFVPLAHISLLAPRLCPVRDGQEIAPGIQVLYLPGHTPGSMGLWIPDQDVILTGDAVKNLSDFVNHTPPPCFGSRIDALASMHKVSCLASKVIPGHDRPFHVQGDKTSHFLSKPSPVELTLSNRSDCPPRVISLGP
ncbi:MAG: MBL fold metallo-hydrolase [Desulfovermiculus sp.]|nr:MBL fold metallo-hydrolase [Desulfovermiculus sp.]